MERVTGEMEAGEAAPTLAAIGARQRGSRLTYIAAVFLLMGAGWAVGYGLGWAIKGAWSQAPLDPILTALAGMYVGYIAYLRLCRPWIIRRFRKRMEDRGLDRRFRMTLELTADALILNVGPIQKTAPWNAVTEIFKANKYWIFLVNMEPWFAPTRFFPTAPEEKAFLLAALGHLTDEARGRSKAAVEFASS